ncbi:hypothetical protein [Streptomyces roseicoloratus]|uniref:Transposase n=1 Tax=Streptomyces roseicoloratus TaxID=2508722 RepID=A0ABY9RPU2_9ACTN|nr:hypothetical protein [Streptomyces roseicoloratus]WMX44212.1 hypothetical protein RGF97_04165 [Streptomyces roseicoloratus]
MPVDHIAVLNALLRAEAARERTAEHSGPRAGTEAAPERAATPAHPARTAEQPRTRTE